MSPCWSSGSMCGGHRYAFGSGSRAPRCARLTARIDHAQRGLSFKMQCQPSHKECIRVADEKLQYNDRMGALREYEKALKDSTLDAAVRRTLLYNSCCIHAAFGDLELAQVPLREAIGLGLDLEQALQSPEPGMLKLKASQQVVIALKRFAKTVGKITKERAEYNPVKGMQLTPAGVRTAMSQEDISNLVGTEMKGAGMDKTLSGILKRVALLLLTLIGLGAGLYVVGLQLLFPDGI
eukprot:jgi/Ulvmu1/4471/UM002_0196.1